MNLVDASNVEGMNTCAASLPPGESELGPAGFTTLASGSVTPPRIAEAPAALECVEHTTLRVGRNRLVVGRVLRVHTRGELFDAESLHLKDGVYAPIGRMESPDAYVHTASNKFELKRPE